MGQWMILTHDFRKNMKNWFLFMAFFALFACNDTPERRYEKMANGWCSCVQPLIEINERAQNLVSKPDSSAAHQADMIKIFREMEAAQKTATACSSILKDKYGVIKSEEWPLAEPFFWKKCPKMQPHPTVLQGMLGE
jgi:hypothetical protein